MYELKTAQTEQSATLDDVDRDIQGHLLKLINNLFINGLLRNLTSTSDCLLNENTLYQSYLHANVNIDLRKPDVICTELSVHESLICKVVDADCTISHSDSSAEFRFFRHSQH